jgi:methionyl aminopeptidase
MMFYAGSIAIKTQREIELMREAARHVAEILLEVRALARPGVTTGELDHEASRSIERRGVVSSFQGYGPHGLPPYPAVMCMSLNEEIVHGIPGPRVLEEGDILSLDFGVSVDGWHGDSAVTCPIGEVASESDPKLVVQGHRPDGARQSPLGHRSRGADGSRGPRLLGGA